MSKTTKTSKSRPGSGKSLSRRDELRRNLLRSGGGGRSLFERPEFIYSSLVLLGFAILSTLLIDSSRNQIHVAPGQIMTDTRLNRLDFEVTNAEETEQARDRRRESVPRMLTFNEPYEATLRDSLLALPQLAAQTPEVEQIDTEVRAKYELDAESIPRLAAFAEGEGTTRWKGWIDELVQTTLRERPIVTQGEYERRANGEPVDLWSLERQEPIAWDQAVGLLREGNAREETVTGIREIVEEAGFPADVARYVTALIVSNGVATFVQDEGARFKRMETEAANVPAVTDRHRLGEIIYRRGDRLSERQYAHLRAEAASFESGAPAGQRWLARAGLFGLIALLTGFVYAAILFAYPRISRNVVRVVALSLLMAGMLALTVMLAAQAPNLLLPAAIAPTLVVTVIVLLSYDQRLALFLSAVQCGLVALALQQGVAWFLLLTLGCGVMIAQLREVRHRHSLIRAAFGTALVLGTAMLFMGLATAPAVEGMLAQILGQAAWGMAAAIIVGFLVLGILPSIEKVFDITTGMTLAELRDPSQPLLRQLQQRAPGTYNHSLQVANIAEAAADAIGANSLLVYVGGLYHDVGKMNKPEYFVENQSGGFNKHRKLRPAMSLLVIIGHVKDGIELAREYGLPRAIQHFIASHHGTTLVEYFYHAAKTEAEEADKGSPAEVEFRYPGPRPRTREAALLMLSDAVESASRAMTEPTPSRIEHLVREISRKRLLDGQFDECDLTFRQLSVVEDAMIARLCAIHHGRIAYPKAEQTAAAEPVEEAAEVRTA